MRVSHSALSTFMQCPMRYKLRYIDKIETPFDYDPHNALVLGTALHTGIEKGVDEAIEYYKSQYFFLEDANYAEIEKLKLIIEACREILPAGEYERKILVDLNEDEFIGYADLLVPVEDNVYDLYDFKYSNNINGYLESAQLHEYKFFLEMGSDIKIRNMYFVFAPKIKTTADKISVKVVKVDYDEKKVCEFFKNLQLLKENINTNREFKKNPSYLCKWCDYFKIKKCDGKRYS